MRRRTLLRRLRRAAIFAAGIALGAGALALAAGGTRQTAQYSGTPVYSVRPTGVGLPMVGAAGTVGAGDYATPLENYHDSGDYLKDLKRVDARARAYLAKRLRTRRGGDSGKPALVLDIDETSLSNYENLASSNFTNATAALAGGVVTADDPPIRPTLNLFKWAKSHGINVFFITGRPGTIPGVRDNTAANLKSAGYSGWSGLTLNDTGLTTVPYKRGARAEIEKKYDILANVGDQESDLQGGNADRAFKLPNPFYFIGR